MTTGKLVGQLKEAARTILPARSLIKKRVSERGGRLCARRRSSGQASRPISTGKLNALLRLHIPPINLVIYQEPSGSYDRES